MAGPLTGKTPAERAALRALAAQRDRRAHLRAPVDFPVAVCSRIWPDGRVELAEAVDLSAGGIAIRSREALALNEELTVAIPVGDGGPPVVVHARISRRTRSGDSWFYGLRFVDAGLKARVSLIRVTFRAAAAALGALKR